MGAITPSWKKIVAHWCRNPIFPHRSYRYRSHLSARWLSHLKNFLKDTPYHHKHHAGSYLLALSPMARKICS